MGKKLVSVEIYATLSGYTWMGYKATKETVTKFTAEKHPFSPKWKGLKDALSFLCKDPDFNGGASISWGCMVVKWYDGKYFLERQTGIPEGKLTAEYLDK